MKRFTAEISLGLATAAEILMIWSYAAGHKPGLHLHLVACLGLLAWFRHGCAQAREQGAEDTILPPSSPSQDAELRRLLELGQDIPAIKRHREMHNSTLPQAVDHIKALRRELTLRPPR